MRTSLLQINFFSPSTWLRVKRALFRVRVTGESMWPELVSGKRYWASGFVRPQVGKYAVFQSPSGEGVFVKKVSRVTNDGYEVTSLVPWGSGSKDFGVVSQRNIIGVLLR